MPLHPLVIPAYTQMMRALAAQLAKAEAHAEAKKFDMEVLLAARLAPDMYPLSDQIRFVCTQALGPVERFGAGNGPAPELAGNSLAELRAYLDATIAYLEAASAEKIDAAASTPMEMNLPNGMIFDLTGFEYIRDWSQPQFYFHLMCAYAILRHNGVDIGKIDYVPHMMRYLRKAA